MVKKTDTVACLAPSRLEGEMVVSEVARRGAAVYRAGLEGGEVLCPVVRDLFMTHPDCPLCLGRRWVPKAVAADWLLAQG